MFRMSSTFTLRTLMLLMLVAVVGMFFVQRYVTGQSRVEILETDLREDSGYVSGAFSFRCSRINEYGGLEYADVVVRLEHVQNAMLMSIKEGDEFVVTCRERTFGPIPSENRYEIFLVRKLGIDKQEIEYRTGYRGWDEFYVKGKVMELP